MNATQKGMRKNQPDVEKSTISASNKARTVNFQVNAGEGSAVFLAGSFNNWNTQAIKMKLDGEGLYKTSVKLAPGRHEYKFMVNGIWLMDEQCKQKTCNPYGSLNSVLDVT